MYWYLPQYVKVLLLSYDKIWQDVCAADRNNKPPQCRSLGHPNLLYRNTTIAGLVGALGIFYRMATSCNSIIQLLVLPVCIILSPTWPTHSCAINYVHAPVEIKLPLHAWYQILYRRTSIYIWSLYALASFPVSTHSYFFACVWEWRLGMGLCMPFVHPPSYNCNLHKDKLLGKSSGYM